MQISYRATKEVWNHLKAFFPCHIDNWVAKLTNGDNTCKMFTAVLNQNQMHKDKRTFTAPQIQKGLQWEKIKPKGLISPQISYFSSDTLEILYSLEISEQQNHAENPWENLHGQQVIMMLKEGVLLVWWELHTHIAYRIGISRFPRNSCGGVYIKYQVASQNPQEMPLLEFTPTEFSDTEVIQTLLLGNWWKQPQAITAFSNSVLETKCLYHFIYTSHSSLHHFEGVGNIPDCSLALFPAPRKDPPPPSCSTPKAWEHEEMSIILQHAFSSKHLQ